MVMPATEGIILRDYLFEVDSDANTKPLAGGESFGLLSTYQTAQDDRIFARTEGSTFSVTKGEKVIGIDFLPYTVDRHLPEHLQGTMGKALQSLEFIKQAYDVGKFEGINIIFGETWEVQMKEFAEKYLGFVTIDEEVSSSAKSEKSQNPGKPFRRSEPDQPPAIRYYMVAEVEDMIKRIDDLMRRPNYSKLKERLVEKPK